MRPKVLICAYAVDYRDVSEAQMAYEWISRLAKYVELIVVTSGSRLGGECGLENMKGVRLEVVRPRLSFRWFDAFDRVVHPAYIEFFVQARRRIKELITQEEIHLGHHLTPQALRYPSPLATLAVPFIAGPYHGGCSRQR